MGILRVWYRIDQTTPMVFLFLFGLLVCNFPLLILKVSSSASSILNTTATYKATTKSTRILQKQQGSSFTTLRPLTKEKLQVISFAALLSDVSYSEDDVVELNSNTNYNLQYYNYGKDAFIVVQYNNYCYVAFRGSLRPLNVIVGTNVQDWFDENFDFRSYSVSNRFSTNDDDNNDSCLVQRGFYDAYYSSGGADDIIHDFIDTCMSSGSSNQQLVLTGHSQGGAAAVIGGIINSSYNPLIITFGQPPVLKEQDTCSILINNSRRLWRIINTENTAGYSINGGGLQYDPVSIIPFFSISLSFYLQSRFIFFESGEFAI
jgi:Lipase (class 3)